MPTIDLAKLLPYALAALAIAIAIGWFVAHDRAVAAKAIAIDRAAGNEIVIAAQQRSLAEKQRVIDLADELSKVRYAETLAAAKSAAQYRAAYETLAKDPDVARVLDTRLPESLRQLRRAPGTAASAGDRVSVLHAAGIPAADGNAADAGSDRGRVAGRDAATPRGADPLQPGQRQSAPADREPGANKGAGFHWPNFLNWFNPAPARSTP